MKKTWLIPALAAGLMTAASTWAAPVTYVVDGKHTFPSFSYTHLGLSEQQSRFNKTEGTVVLDLEKQSASVDVTIDMTSIDTGSSMFDTHIQGGDFLDTEKHPKATFKSSKVVFEDGEPKLLVGNLTLKGVTKKVTMEITHFKAMPHPMMKKPAIGANATTTLKRSDFNMGKYAPAVDDEVLLSIALEAVAK